jgi:choice-of-anchor B domain-containing protein
MLAPVPRALVLVLLLAATPLAAQSHRSEGPPLASLTGFGTAIVVTDEEAFIGRTGEVPGFPMPAATTGAVHIYRRSADGWIEYASVTGSRVEIGDGFGQALAVHGDLLVVGSPGRDDGRGAVYLFRRDGDGWSEVARLHASDAAAGDALGSAVAVSGATLVASAPSRDSSQGIAYAFRRNASTGEWTEVGALKGSEAAESDRFGAALAMDGHRLLVGAPGPSAFSIFGSPVEPKSGRAYLFIQDEDGGWREDAQLTPGDTTPAAMGSAVWLSGDEAMVGAPLYADGTGAVLVFRRDESSSSWSRVASISREAGPPQSLFGAAFAPVGDDVIVGAPIVMGATGAAFVFRRDEESGDWEEIQKLDVPASGMMTLFGSALAAAADVAVLAAPGADFFEGMGYVYRRDAETGQWRESGAVFDESGLGLEPIIGSEAECDDGTAALFGCADVDLLAFLPVQAVGGKRGIMMNDVWGWTDPETGKEYALAGRFDATTFIDITDPTSPVYLGELQLHEGAQPNLWRDIKVYKDHAFIVADNAGPHGMQVFDLTKLREVSDPPVTFEETAHYDVIASAHNIVINEESGFAFTVGNSGGGQTCGGALHMIDIRNPLNPTFAGCYADPATGLNQAGSTHDGQCVIYRGPDERFQGREVCFNSSETALGIADVTDKTNPQPISSASYPNVAYAHQGWLSDDHKYFFLNDELDELSGTVPATRTIVWDIEDLEDPVVLVEFIGTNGATDHNLYVHGNYMYQSNYVSGLRIIDISDPANPVEVGFFDTVPVGDDVPGFAGSWSNYPFFESGTIVVTSMREGVFLVRHRERTLVP